MNRGSIVVLAPLLAGAAPAQTVVRAPFEAAVVEFDPYLNVRELADLDGDGDLDAIGWWWKDGARNRIVVHGDRNDGTGEFAPLFRVERPASSITLWAMARGRFDRDARDDFVIWLNGDLEAYTSDAGGQPLPYAQLAVWSPPLWGSLAVADFDRDGLDDLAIGSFNQVALYRNTGSGFALASSLNLPAYELHVGELDGDGAPDLLAVYGSYCIRLAAVGGTSLQVVGSHQVTLPGNLDNMWVVGDIDGDGDDDVVAFSNRGRYEVLRRTGPSSLELEASRAGGPATGLADIDGDGDLDGVCCGGGGGSGNAFNQGASMFEISINDGTGAFAPAWGMPNIGAERLAGAADIDGDGDLDLLGGRGVFFHRGSFARDPMPWSSFGLTADGFGAADEDGDGDPDVRLRLSGSYSVWVPPGCFHNDGSGRFQFVEARLPAPPSVGTALVGPGWDGDFDGDGDVDLIVGVVQGSTHLGMRLLRNVGNGGYVDGGWSAQGANFGFGATWTTGNNRVLADLDADGDLDMVTTSLQRVQVWRNDGSGGFGLVQGLSGPAIAHAMADVDGDGNVDLIARRWREVVIAWGRGDCTFEPGETILAIDGTSMEDRPAVADLDGDGDIDLCATFNGDTMPTLWENRGSRTFLAHDLLTQHRLTSAINTQPHAHAGDVDGDGHTDLIFAYPLGTPGASYVLLADGQGGFRDPVAQVLMVRALVDADGDGDLDVLTGDRMVRGARFAGSAAGHRLQYGSGGTGAGGFVPRLGAVGPFREGERAATLLSGAPGGTAVSWVFAAQRDARPDWPFAGMVGYAYPVLLALPLAVGGGAGAGEGSLRVPYTVPPGVAGLSIYQQMHVLDATRPHLLNWTAGLELTFGR